MDELHGKLQEVEAANISLKQNAIEHVRIIATLENTNQTLEAKVKKLSEAKDENYEELQKILMLKDEKIEKLIDEISI